jgi:hypothetical protein
MGGFSIREVHMNNNRNKNIRGILSILWISLLFLCFLPAGRAQAEEAQAVSFGKIDYDNLTIQVYKNNNVIIYYSTDKITWVEAEGNYDSAKNMITMDISWVSVSSDVTLYFKGSSVSKVQSITLPMQNSSIKVTYNKVSNEFTFSDAEESDSFQWRKSTDYHWNTVKLDETSSSYNDFIDTVDTFRVMGAKLIFRLPQTAGTYESNVGYRPSKEVTVSILKRANAPSVKVNIAKLNLSTTQAMEYYDTKSSMWLECTRTMTIEDIAPEVLYKKGAKSVTLKIRTAETTTMPYSKTAYLTIPGQAAAPVIGDNSDDVTYYYVNSKLVMQFPKASTSNQYEYCVIRFGSTFDVSTASWRTVTSSKLMNISKSSAPEDCSIYVRKKGIAENTAKNISLVLPSAESYFSVKYPVIVQQN